MRGRIVSLVLAVAVLIGMAPAPGGATPAVPSDAAPAPAGGRPGAEIPPEVSSQFESAPLANYFVTFEDRADLTAASAIRTRDERRIAVVAALRAQADASQAALISLLEAGRARGGVDQYRAFWVKNAVWVRSDETFLKLAATLPGVESIDPDRAVSIIRTAPSQLATAVAQVGAEYPWNIERVNAPGAWNTGITGSSVVVANIDTGVDPTHPSLATKYRGSDGDHDYDWWDAVNGNPSPYDDNDHGTHTMGTMVGGDGPGPDPNDIGVAYEAKWIAAKAFSSGGWGTDADLLEAGQFIAAPTRVNGLEPRPDLAPDVVNNSWGGGSCDTFYEDMVESWRALDIFPAFAIGNSGSSAGSADSPGDHPASYAAGATDSNDAIAYFSSRGPSCWGEIKPEVVAPGVAVRSSVAGGGFASYQGTSMATPHVAAGAALVMEAGAGAVRVDDAETILSETARDLGATGPDNTFGAGMIQIDDAVISALQGGAITGTVTDTAGDPIAGARVILSGAGLPTRVAPTDAGGVYRTRAVAGDYDVTVRAFGYLDATLSAEIEELQVTTVDAALDNAPIVTLAGTVTEGPANTPLQYVEVNVLDTPLAPDSTDVAGAYSFDLPAGTYDVRAYLDGCREAAQVTLTLTENTAHDFSLARMVEPSGYVCDRVPFTDERGTTRAEMSGYSYSKNAEISLPFAFDYFGQPYTKVWANTNGYVSFKKPTLDLRKPDWVNRSLPNTDEPNLAIYALWDWLHVRGSARGIYTATLGSAPERRFVIEYRNFEVMATGDLVNFSVVLYENGTAEVRYRSLEGVGNGQAATVGIEGPKGRNALQYSSDEAFLIDGSAVRFFPSDSFGIVRGTVTAAADGAPLADLLVTADGRSVVTASGGGYQIGVSPGTHDVSVAVPAGYGAASQSVTVAAGEVTAADFALLGPRATLAPAALTFDADDGIQGAPIVLSNSGSEPLDFEIETRASTAAGDSGDDADGIVEVRDASALATPDGVEFRTHFSPGTPMDDIYGRFIIDIDQNEATGSSESWWEGKADQHIGVDYVVYFSTSYGIAWVYRDDDYAWKGSFPFDVAGKTLSFTLPMATFDNDDGALNYAMSAGDLQSYWYPEDYAPDFGHGRTDATWLTHTLAAGTLAPGASVDASLTVDPTGTRPGDNRGRIYVRSNDVLSPASLDVSLVAPEDTTPPSVAWSTPDGGVVGNNNVVETIPSMNGTANDASGIGRVVVKFTPVISTGTSTFERIATVTCDAVGTSCTWKSTAPIGQYRVTPVVTDQMGLTTTGPTITITAV